MEKINATLLINGKEIHKFIGYQGETVDEIRKRVMESLALTIEVVPAPIEI